MSLFGAFVRARVCWCSECGQAARTEQVGVGLSGRGGGGRTGAVRGTRRAGGAGPGAATPCWMQTVRVLLLLFQFGFLLFLFLL